MFSVVIKFILRVHTWPTLVTFSFTLTALSIPLVILTLYFSIPPTFFALSEYFVLQVLDSIYFYILHQKKSFLFKEILISNFFENQGESDIQWKFCSNSVSSIKVFNFRSLFSKKNSIRISLKRWKTKGKASKRNDNIQKLVTIVIQRFSIVILFLRSSLLRYTISENTRNMCLKILSERVSKYFWTSINDSINWFILQRGKKYSYSCFLWCRNLIPLFCLNCWCCSIACECSLISGFAKPLNSKTIKWIY